MAVILPDSFKAAALAAVAGIPRRVGYEQDGRGALLTDRLVPRRHRGALVPVSTLDSYLGIARYLGADDPSAEMRQLVRPDSLLTLKQCLAERGIDAAEQELMLVHPGTPAHECPWTPREMADLCERMADRYGVTPIVVGKPADRDAVEQLLEQSSAPVLDLSELGRDLHLLKAMISCSRLVVTRDTGPRCLAAALHAPSLTLFDATASQGPRADTGSAHECSVSPIHPGSGDVFEQACALYERTRPLNVVEAGA